MTRRQLSYGTASTTKRTVMDSLTLIITYDQVPVLPCDMVLLSVAS
jgi:hypothetical protein